MEYDVALKNRNNVVNAFHDSIDNYVLSYGSNRHELIFENKNKGIKIVRNLQENSYSFWLERFISYQQQPVSPIFNPHEILDWNEGIYYLEFMKLTNSTLEMVECGSTSWIYHEKIMSFDENKNHKIDHYFKTKMTLSYMELPRTEEMYFQKMTQSEVIIDLPECLKIYEIVDHLQKLGTIVQVSPEITVNLLF